MNINLYSIVYEPETEKEELVSWLKRKVLTLRDGDEVWKLKAKRRSEKEPLLYSCSYSYRRCNSMMTHISLLCGCGIIVDNVSFYELNSVSILPLHSYSFFKLVIKIVFVLLLMYYCPVYEIRFGYYTTTICRYGKNL